MTEHNQAFIDAVAPFHRVLLLKHVGPRKNRWMMSLIQTVTINTDTTSARVTYKIRRESPDGTQKHSWLLPVGMDVNQASTAFADEVEYIRARIAQGVL